MPMRKHRLLLEEKIRLFTQRVSTSMSLPHAGLLEQGESTVVDEVADTGSAPLESVGRGDDLGVVGAGAHGNQINTLCRVTRVFQKVSLLHGFSPFFVSDWCYKHIAWDACKTTHALWMWLGWYLFLFKCQYFFWKFFVWFYCFWLRKANVNFGIFGYFELQNFGFLQFCTKNVYFLALPLVLREVPGTECKGMGYFFEKTKDWLLYNSSPSLTRVLLLILREELFKNHVWYQI